ncbi:glycosyltransferase [Planctomycetales bacterium ZRK34]|nr:glycosyltransferase [Planctomycetales bacterium ZRK34]
MRLTYVIITWNRCQRLLATLQQVVERTPLLKSQYEIFVVDNASTDGTAEAVAERFPHVQLIRLRRNEGMAARNHAIALAAGEYITILDDDSYPVGEAVARSMRYMDIHPRTAAVTGRVILPNGGYEASALPGVMIGCATTLRRSAIEQVGAFAPEFFRQAEEYDLSFRLAAAGFTVERFEDLEFRHDKHVRGRSSSLTVRMDLRNNLILAHRYLPGDLRREYLADWTQRYRAIAAAHELHRVAKRAMWEARAWAMRERWVTNRVLGDEALEQMFGLEEQARSVAGFARRHRLRRVVIGDLGKNIYATWRACHEAGLSVCGVADNNPTFNALTYRDVAVRGDKVAIDTLSAPDGIILSNVNPAQVEARAAELRKFGLPVLAMWSPRTLQRLIVERGAAARERDHAA